MTNWKLSNLFWWNTLEKTKILYVWFIGMTGIIITALLIYGIGIYGSIA